MEDTVDSEDTVGTAGMVDTVDSEDTVGTAGMVDTADAEDLADTAGTADAEVKVEALHTPMRVDKMSLAGRAAYSLDIRSSRSPGYR
ncbi:hypothetical protein FACS18948_4970 [Clostridia bacterium]|nr:hypothetical protein FACS18948_4970 [Clostridia bacterium]